MSKKIKVNSSNLEFVEYIADRKELRIWFLNEKNAVYAYSDVSQKIYDELIKASSIGGFFTDYIKYKYQFVKKIDQGTTLSDKMNPEDGTYCHDDVKEKIKEYIDYFRIFYKIENDNHGIIVKAKEIFGGKLL